MRLRTRLILGAVGVACISVGLWLKTHAPFPNQPARETVGTLSFSRNYIDDFPYTQKYKSGEGPPVALIASAGREPSDFNELVSTLNRNGYSSISVEPHALNDYVTVASGERVDDPNLIQMSFPLRRIAADNYESSIVLIGHAFGNRIVRMTAYHNPENVEAVILLAAGGQVPMKSKAEQSLRDIFNPMKSHKSRMKDVSYAFFAEGNDIPDHWTRGWHTKTAIAQGKAVAASADDDSWHCAGGVPMLIVQPMQDRIAPPANAYALRDKCPQEVEIVEVQNAGHALLPEQPEAVAEAVLAFLAKHHPVN